MGSARRMLAKIRREPLLAFCVVAVALFALAPRGERGDEVHVGRRNLKSLEDAEARRRHVSELPAAVAASVRQGAIDDELLYREGLRLGLDRNDNIVRQRVIEKMLFLAEDLAGSGRPVSDDELDKYLRAHTSDFRRPTIVSFVHVFAATDAAMLARLRPTLAAGVDGAAGDAPACGDAFPLGRRVVDASLDAIGKSYGAAFADAVAKLPVGSWSEPVASLYGHHLVKVLARKDGGTPTLADVRGEVRIAYLQERKARATAELLRAIRARYRVVVDDGGGDGRAAAATGQDD